MGRLRTSTNQTTTSTCQDEEKEAKLRERQSPDPVVLDFNSLLDASTGFFVKETMLSVLELVPQFTLLQSWSTWLLRSLSWQAMLPVTTRRPESSHVTYNWPSGTMKS